MSEIIEKRIKEIDHSILDALVSKQEKERGNKMFYTVRDFIFQVLLPINLIYHYTAEYFGEDAITKVGSFKRVVGFFDGKVDNEEDWALRVINEFGCYEDDKQLSFAVLFLAYILAKKQDFLEMVETVKKENKPISWLPEFILNLNQTLDTSKTFIDKIETLLLL